MMMQQKEKKFISFSFPDMEIHKSKDPIALMITPSGQIRPYIIHAKDRYFIINERKIRGIFTLNNKYRFSWGRTPVYIYAVPETNPIDPIIIDQLNRYKKMNKLTEITHKDIEHGSRLRILMKQKRPGEAMTQLQQEAEIEGNRMSETVDIVKQQMDQQLHDLKTLHQKDIDVPDSQKGYVLLEHLMQQGLISKLELADLTNKITGGTTTFDNLVDELKHRHLVSVSEPLDENIEDFVQDLGAQNARDMAGFVEGLRNSKKGLKDLTAVPAKAWMPAGYILAIMIGGVIAIPVLLSQWPAIQKAMNSGGGGFSLPGVNMEIFTPGGFIFQLASSLLGVG